MPRYDYRCAAGHVEEVVAPVTTSSTACPRCGVTAERVAVPSRPPRVNGFALQPMRERPIRLDRAVNAQHEMVARAARQGITLPDPLTVAKRQAARIRRHAPEIVTGT